MAKKVYKSGGEHWKKLKFLKPVQSEGIKKYMDIYVKKRTKKDNEAIKVISSRSLGTLTIDEAIQKISKIKPEHMDKIRIALIGAEAGRLMYNLQNPSRKYSKTLLNEIYKVKDKELMMDMVLSVYPILKAGMEIESELKIRYSKNKKKSH